MKTAVTLITLFIFCQIQSKGFDSPDDLSDSVVTLQDKASGKCFQLKNGKAFKGNTIELGDCDQTNPSQQFYLTERSDGSYKFASMIDWQFCIDNKNRYKENANLILRPCRSDSHRKVRNQKIFIEKVSGREEMTMSFGKRRITYAGINENNRVKEASQKKDATIWEVLLAQNTSLATENDLSTLIVILRDKTSGKCLQLKNGKAFNGNIVKLDNCDKANTAQRFYLNERSDGSYKFSSMVDRKFCINNNNNEIKKNEGSLIVWRCLSDNHKDVHGQKIFINKFFINQDFRAELTISFETNIVSFVRVDGNNVNQTLDENDATVWKVSFVDDFNSQANLSENDLSDSIVILQDKTSGKCFQLKSGKSIKRNTIELGDCDQTHADQQFYLTERPDGSYKFASMADKRFCIDNNNQYKEDVGLIVRRCRSNNHRRVHNQKIFIEIEKTSGMSKMMISFKSKNGKRITYIHVDGNNINQTLNENNATFWKVLLDTKTPVNSPNTRAPRSSGVGNGCTESEVSNGSTCVSIGSNGWAGGSGTADDPYIIANYQGLKTLSSRVNQYERPGYWDYTTAYYKLGKDIDASASHDEDGGFVPIGNICNNPKKSSRNMMTPLQGAFRGKFDGAGLEISNLYVNRPDDIYGGLFGCVSGNVEIKDLVLKNFTIHAKWYVAALVGRVARYGWHSFHYDKTVARINDISLTGNISITQSVPKCRVLSGFLGRTIKARDNIADLHFQNIDK